MSQNKNYTKKVLLILCLSLQAACSTIAEIDIAMAGEPENAFLGESTILTKYMAPNEVSNFCSDVISPSKNTLQWYHACTYKNDKEGIVMVMPTPGSVAPKTFGKIIMHEYQHVGQAVKREKMNHEHWH